MEVVDPDGARRVLLRREATQLSLSAWDAHSRRLVVSVDSAPFVFDPSIPTRPEEAPAPAPAPDPVPERKPRHALWGTKVKKEEAKPSMFPAPASTEVQDKKGETP